MDLLELWMTLNKETECGIIVNGKFLGVFHELPDGYDEALVDMIVPVGMNQLNVYLKK